MDNDSDSSRPQESANPINADARTVAGFGQEWTAFDQTGLDAATRQAIFDGYFSIFPWQAIGPHAVGADIGCGSGRWAALVAPLVGTLHLVDASKDALATARAALAGSGNTQFHLATASALPFADGSLDFAYSLGVLHHVPDTEAAIAHIATKLKPGAPFLIYLYYAMENRPAWYRLIWKATDLVRGIVWRLPHPLRLAAAYFIAATVYWPLARTAPVGSASWPLRFYRDKPFFVMATDAYDRFSTPIEQRFSRRQIAEMLQRAGFNNVTFSEREPFWCAVGYRS